MSEQSHTETVYMRQQQTAVDGLRFAQTNTANYLEIAMLAAAEHPGIAKKIRLTAHAAQEQHSLTSECVMKCVTSSRHVIDSLLPMILEGIDMQEPEIIKAAFEEIKLIGKEMLDVTNGMTKRYLAIQTDIQTLIADVDITKKDLKDELGKLRGEKEVAKLEVKSADDTVQKQEEELARLAEENKQLRSEQRRLSSGASTDIEVMKRRYKGDK